MDTWHRYPPQFSQNRVRLDLSQRIGAKGVFWLVATSLPLNLVDLNPALTVKHGCRPI
jgi:hypothetical protein